MAGANPSMLIRIAVTLDELKKNLAEGKVQIETTSAAMGKLASSFSGDRLVQHAMNVTAAISKVGASTLTAGEAARSLGVLEKAMEKLTLTGKPIPGAMQSVADSLKKIEPPANAADKALGVLKGAFASFTLAGLATNAISSLTSGLMEFANVGLTKFPAVQASFGRLTKGVGANAQEMLDAMGDATKGLVSDYDLMLAANKAILLGLPVTTESMGDLAKTAATLGKAMGQDATKSFDDLITALGRSSPMILDNLGLSVKVGEANEIYAAKLGKTADALTDAEKKTAFYQAAMEAAKKKTDELGAQTLTLSEIASSVWTKIGNAVTKEAARINNAFGPEEQAYAFKFFYALHLDAAAATADLKELASWWDVVNQKEIGTPKIPVKPGMFSGSKMPEITLGPDAMDEIGKGYDEIGKKLDVAGTKAKAAADAYRESLNDLRDAFYGKGVIAAAKDWVVALGPHPNLANASREQLDVLNLSLSKGIETYARHGEVAPQAMRDLWLATFAGIPAVNGLTGAWKTLGTEIDVVVPKFVDTTKLLTYTAGIPWGSKVGEQIKVVVPSMKNLETTWTKSLGVMEAGLASFGGRLGQFGTSIGGLLSNLQTADAANVKFGGNLGVASAMFSSSAKGTEKWASAVQSGAAIAGGAMDVWAATSGNAAKGANTLHGAVAGAKAGAAFGPYGMAVGAAAGALVGFVRALDAGRDKVKDFAKTFGGFDELQKKLETLGEEGGKLWVSLTQGVGRGDPKQAQKVIDQVTAALAKNEKQIQENIAGVSDLVGKWVYGGKQIPIAVQASIDKLVTMGKLTKDNAIELLGLANVGVPSLADIEAAAGRYGLSLDVLGGKIDQIRITETANAIVADWDLLASAGADVGAVMAGMAETVQPLVDSALRFGRELPESMRPMLEKMVEAGTLTDATGGKLEDLSGITFTVDPIDALVAKLDELIATLTNSLPAAFRGLGNIRVPPIDVPYNVRPIAPRGGGDEEPGYAGGTHGQYVDFGRGTSVTLHGRERIVTEGEGRGSSDDGGYVPVTIMMPDGDVLAHQIVKVRKKLRLT